MLKLTQRQHKDNDRIAAWLAGEPFRENSRDKHPGVPVLDTERVLAEYTPPYAQDFGQFFTPLAMAREAFWSFHIPDDPALKVLEPTAGIGHLVYQVQYLAPRIQVDAYELNQECAAIGAKLFPGVTWTWGDPWDRLADLEGQYDYVAMNPPFGNTVGLGDARERSLSGAKRGEHLFLELALRALKPGGQALIIAPANLLDSLPQAAHRWFLDHGELLDRTDYLPGAFALTAIRVQAFIVRTKPAPAAVSPGKAVKPDLRPPARASAAAPPDPVPAWLSAIPAEAWAQWQQEIADLYHEYRFLYRVTPPPEERARAYELLTGGPRADRGSEFRRYCRVAVSTYLTQGGREPENQMLAQIAYENGACRDGDFPETGGVIPWHLYLSEPVPAVPTPPPAAPDPPDVWIQNGMPGLGDIPPRVIPRRSVAMQPTLMEF